MALTHHLPIRIFQAGVLVAALVLGLIAGVDPKIALAGAAGMIFVALVLADLAIGLALFTVAAFLEALPSIGPVSFPKIAGLLLLLSWFGTIAIQRREDPQPQRLPTPLVLALLLIPAWALTSSLWAISTSGAVDSAQRWALNLVLCPIAFAAIRRTKDVELVFVMFVVGTIISTVLGYFGILSTAEDLNAESGRLGGAGINANQLGGLLVCGTVFAGALAGTRGRSVPARGIWLLIAALSAMALAATLSRGAIVGMLVAFVIAPFIAGKRRRLPAFALSVMLASTIALAVVALLPATAVQRLSSSDKTGTGRTDIWRVGWRMVKDRPVIGVGAGNFDDTTIRYLVQPGAIQRDEFIVDHPKVAHNIYLQVLAEMGVIGLALFLVVIGFCLISALRAATEFARRDDQTGELLARALALALIGLLAADFFSSQLYSKQVWLLLALGPAMLATARRTKTVSA